MPRIGHYCVEVEQIGLTTYTGRLTCKEAMAKSEEYFAALVDDTWQQDIDDESLFWKGERYVSIRVKWLGKPKGG